MVTRVRHRPPHGVIEERHLQLDGRRAPLRDDLGEVVEHCAEPAHDLQLARPGMADPVDREGAGLGLGPRRRRRPSPHWTKVQLAGRNAGTRVKGKGPVACPTATGNGMMPVDRSAVKEETL